MLIALIEFILSPTAVIVGTTRFNPPLISACDEESGTSESRDSI
ncbi:MAG: hypothetical protein OCD76_18720 [Reichenbachiella sp.]